jgi:hypothetical protein
MNVLDSRDLIEKREELKEKIFNNFLAYFPQYEDMTDSYDDILMDEEEIQDWKEGWSEEINHIEEIDSIEDEIGSDFDYGITLIDENDMEEYVKDLLEDLGYIPKDFPSWIEIDWSSTADNVKQDYSEVTYQGTEYLYRNC